MTTAVRHYHAYRDLTDDERAAAGRLRTAEHREEKP